jgi:hypothetical protein
MKKHLLKLFSEAGFHQPEMERLGIEHKFEKFAELIVKECAAEADKYAERGSWMAGYRIKQHFGVEE